MTVFLRTARLYLRRFTPDDIDLLVDLDSDPDVMFHITGGIATTRDAVADEYLPAYLDYYRRYPGYGFWAAHRRDTDEFLGWFHFRPGEGAPPDEPELGYRLRRSAWGHGYATEGARALIDRGFEEFGVQRVVAEAMVVNTASWRVMEKCGMTRVRVFHQDWPYAIPGEEHGDVEYAITRAQWQRGRNG